MLFKETTHKKSFLTAELVKAALEKQNEPVTFEFENKDQLSIWETTSEYAGIGSVTYFEVTFGEYAPGYFEDGKDAYLASYSEYFPPQKLDDAVTAFMTRLTAESPARYTNLEHFRRYRLEEIAVFNKQILYFENHYTYLDLMLEPFWQAVFQKTPSEMWCGGIVSAHGDKARQYNNVWKKAGINSNRGALLFLLTYTSIFEGQDKAHSDQWVIENYPRYLHHIEAVENAILAQQFS